MNFEIDKMIRKFRESRPSLQKLTMVPKLTFTETRPMKSVLTDLFLHAGNNYLVLLSPTMFSAMML